MKGPTYILKNKHLEQEEKREYQQHVLKLKNIQGMAIKGGLIASVSVDKKFVEDKEQKKTSNRLFKEEEQKRLQKLENKALIAKLEAIQKGKYSIMKNIKEQTYKESVQHLSQNYNLKSGINFHPNPTQKMRQRTMTANTESFRNPNSMNQNRYGDNYDDANTAPASQQDSRTAHFFNNNYNDQHPNHQNLQDRNNFGDTNQRDVRQGQFNPNINSNYNQNANNGGDMSNRNNNLHPNITNGSNKNKEDDDPSVMNPSYNPNQMGNQNNQSLDRLRHNSKKSSHHINSTGDRENQPKTMKTEGNYIDDNYGKYDNENNPNIYQNYNGNNPNIYQNGNGNNPNMHLNGHNQDNAENQTGDNRFRIQPNSASQERNNGLSRDGKRRRINSSINLVSLNKHVAGSIDRQKEQERIALENNKIVQRMMKLPPVIPTKSKLKKEFKKQKQLKNQISKFHEFQERKIPSYLKSKKDENGNNIGLIDGIPLDENNKELMDQRVHLVINVKEIAFVNFLPISTETEKYYMQIQASIHEIRRTNPEVYMDFSKSVINEFFYLRELKQSKIMYIGLYKWTPLDNGEHFLGDFELDLTPYYLQSGTHQIHYDLRNFKQMHKLPNYMVKDMRKKGWIDIEISIRSSVKQYLLDLDIIKKEHHTQEPSYQYDQNISPSEKKMNSEEQILQLMSQHQTQQTEKQQKLLQQKPNQSKKGQLSLNSQNASVNQGNKSIASNQQNNNLKDTQSRQSLASNNISQQRAQNSNNITDNQIRNNERSSQQQDDYEQEQFEKESSNNLHVNNSYDQNDFTDQDDNLKNYNQPNQYNLNIEEEIDL